MLPTDQPIKPFKITDEYYYIGSNHGPANLLVTSDGLVLIDTSYPENLDMLLDNIRSLGFDPMDIKHIIHSHGHLDHYGSTPALVKMTGAKTYLGAPDADYVMGIDSHCTERARAFAFTPDVLINDGDVIKFGDTEIRFVSTPGHTYGVISMFMTLHVGGKPYLAGMFGGAGLNTMSDEFFETRDYPKTMRNLYVESVNKIIDEPVEIHLGNHLGDNKAKIKMKHLDNGVNPFLADNTWRSFLESRRDAVIDLMKQ